MKQYISFRNITTMIVLLGLLTACGGGAVGTKDSSHNGIDYNTVKSPYTGRIWIDRNVGATRVCKSSTDKECYGDYYQFGRNTDGHEKKDSKTRNTLIRYLNQSDDKFFIGDHKWFAGPTSVLIENWAKLDGSSVCPKNFRVATGSEFYDELLRDGNSAQAIEMEDLFKSFLKLPKAGFRYYRHDDHSIYGAGIDTEYWAADGDSFGTDSGVLGVYNEFQLYSLGRPIRCIKEK